MIKDYDLLHEYFSSNGKRKNGSIPYSKDVGNLIRVNEKIVVFYLNEKINGCKTVDELRKILQLGMEAYAFAGKDLHMCVNQETKYNATKCLLKEKLGEFGKKDFEQCEVSNIFGSLQNIVSIMEFVNIDKVSEMWHSKMFSFFGQEGLNKENLLKTFSQCLESVLDD